MKKKFLSLLFVLSMLLAFMPIMAAADTPITQTTATITKTETDTTYNFDVTPEAAYANCYVYAAAYDVNGALLNVNRVPLETTGNTNISVDKSVYNASAKVFIWSDDMQPIIEAEEFTLTPTATLPPRPTATPTPKPTATPKPTPKPPSNVTWSLDEATGTLTISGTGDMKDYDDFSSPFFNNRNIKSVVIANGVTSIGEYAFEYCHDITSVTIPDSVTSIGYYAFLYCSGLTDVYYNGSFSDIEKLYISYGNTQLTNAKLHCSDMTLDNWGKCGDTVAYCLDEATGTLTISGTGDMKNYGGLDSVPWHSKCSSIKSVIIENGVTSICNYAFYECSGLTNVTIPDSVSSICSYAFYKCSGLTSVTIGNSITSIGDYAFSDCSSLTSITIPDSVTSIGGNAFAYCSNLDSVYITDLAAYLNIDGISPMCYAKKLYLNNKRIAGDIIIPENVINICAYAFNGCDGITSITIPDSVSRIGLYAFQNCSNLTDVYITDLSAWYNIKFGDYSSNPMRYADNLYLNNELVTNIVIPDGVTSIGNYVFSGCKGLTSVIIPDSVTSIGKNAFSGCSGLTSLTIPDRVTSIGDYAFYNCMGLTSLTIPDSVTSIGKSAFEYCVKLESVHITDLAAWCNITFDLTKNEYNYSYCLSNPMRYANNLYLNNELVTDLVIPDSVTSISDCAFYYCSGLTSVTIPDSVTSIGRSAFYGCSGLKSLTIGNGITNINSKPFEKVHYINATISYDSLSEIIIPKSVTEIEIGAFENFSALTTVKYCGSEAEWNEMYIGSNNDYLKNANIVFDYVVENDEI